MWRDLFDLTLPAGEKVLRTVLVYALIVVLFRILGKRDLASLNTMDFVVMFLLSNVVQNAIIGDDNTVSGGIIGATSLLVVNYLVVRFLYTHKSLDQFIEGKADVLIDKGKVRTDHLKKELISMQQLAAAARKQGFDDLSEVEQCILEPGGTMTFIKKKPDSDDSRHMEIMRRFEMVTEELARMRKALPEEG
jgi:uncharacterized membrane protein YcaP (DUF421 family)